MIVRDTSRGNRNNNISSLIWIYIVLLLNYYYIIAQVFSYEGYSTDYFTIQKMFITCFYTLYIIFLSVFIKKRFYRLIYSIALIIYFFGQTIYYLFNDSSVILMFLASLPLISILFADIIDNGKNLKRKTVNLKDKSTRFFIIFIAALAVVPYFRYISTINLKNLLFIDIYDTRSLIRTYDQGLLGYFFSPLSRTVFPFLFVYGFKERKKMLVIFSIVSVILLFLLNGAVKSVFLGIILAMFFLKGNYLFKEKLFLRGFQILNVLGLLSYWILNNNLINDYLRRIILVPARLYDVYYNYFLNNYTFFTHSNLYSLISNTDSDMSISRYIGEVVLGKDGLNANTGIFVEGFVSFGIIGVILSSLIFMIILVFMRKVNFPHEYFGIFIAYVYIINTSFVETLFISHGLLFFLIFIYLFSTKEKNDIEISQNY